MPPKKTLEQDLLMLGGAKPAVLKLTEAASDKVTTAADYAKHWSEEGYGVALMDDKNGKVVQAYFDANDYPSLANRVVNQGQGGGKIVGTKFSLELHSGQLETALAQQQDEEDQKQYKQALAESVKQGGSLDEDWKMRVRKSYDSLDELKKYDELYGIASRLGYSSAEELWEKNPVIAGSVNPSDLRVIKEGSEGWASRWRVDFELTVRPTKQTGEFKQRGFISDMEGTLGGDFADLLDVSLEPGDNGMQFSGDATFVSNIKDWTEDEVIDAAVEIFADNADSLYHVNVDMDVKVTNLNNAKTEDIKVQNKRADEFFRESRHGKAIARILGGEWNAKKVEAYLDKEGDDVKAVKIIDFISSDAGLDISKYKTLGEQLPVLIKKLESLYKDFIKNEPGRAGVKVQEAEESSPEFEVTGTIKLGYEWDVSAYVPTAEYSGPGSFRVESPEFSARLKDEVLLGSLQDKVSGYGSGNTSFPFSLVIEAKDADEAKEKALASLSDKTQWDTNLYIEGEYQAEHPDMTITDITVEIDEVIQEDASSSARNRWSVEFDFEIEPLSDKQIDSYTEDMSGDLGGDVADLLKVYTEVRSPQSDESVLKIWGEGTLLSSHDLTGDEIANEVADIIGTYSYNNYKRSVNNLNILSSKKIVPKIGTLKEATVEGVTDIVGQKIVDVRPMTISELANEGWEDTMPSYIPMALVLANGAVLYPSQDPEGNGPGAFWIIKVHEPSPLWGKESEVKGKTIQRVRRATAKIVSTLDFNRPTAELVLDGNISILAGADNEGNGSGTTFMSWDDKVYTIGESKK